MYSSSLSWWFVAGVTPLPIPNREVKPCRTDDSLFEAKVGSCQDCALEYIQNTKSHNFDLSLLWFFVFLGQLTPVGHKSYYYVVLAIIF